MPSPQKIIIGIDPGTTIMGYGVILVEGKKLSLLQMGVLDMRKQKDHYTKLRIIFERVTLLIEEFHPHEMALEAPFYGKNVQSMLKLGRGQGVAMAAALVRSIPIFEYAPRKIKMAITGQGAASKEQVAEILKNILKMKEFPDNNLDATDGLAAAVCHFYQSSNPVSEASYKGWGDFISKNPERLKGK